MSDNKRKKGLGRGLSALLEDVSPTTSPKSAQGAAVAPIDLIFANPDQPRRTFRPEEMEELASSIRAKGVLQPLLVRSNPNGEGYQIIAGERRWRAAQMAQLHEAPIIVRELSDTEVLEVAIIENIQRADLNPIEEAAAYAQLIEKFGHTQAQLAASMGKSRAHIANTTRLLVLPDDVREHVAANRLSAGHARALITAHDPSALAKRVIVEGLSVRQTEALAKSVASSTKSPGKVKTKDADTRLLEGDLSAALGLNVAIDHKGENGGVLRISYKTLEDLDGVCQLLNAAR